LNPHTRYKTGPILLIGLLLVLSPARGLLAKEGYDCGALENKDKPTTVEITLSQKWKGHVDEVREALTSEPNPLKARIRIFPFLDPPTNIGIGKCVSAEEARRAIREAIRYNRGIDRLIIQDIMPHHWVKIGATDVAELAWIPIDPNALTELTDPALSTEQFQALYRRLAVQKERKLPFGMGSQKREEKR
jgi:hypothetical protein